MKIKLLKILFNKSNNHNKTVLKRISFIKNKGVSFNKEMLISKTESNFNEEVFINKYKRQIYPNNENRIFNIF